MSVQTTHSPNFLGLHQNMGLWEDSNYGKGVIIGVLDSGVMPEHPSFSDEGMPPPPAKWKGECEFSHTTCNNKIIGAKYFNDGDQSPLDDNGHGTHMRALLLDALCKAQIFLARLTALLLALHHLLI